MASRPALRGGALALAAAFLFGASTPLLQLFGAGVGPFATAALLYAGAAIAGALLQLRIEREARLVRSDIPRLILMAAFGAVLGPVALAWGLQRTGGTGASLMLSFEALFTIVIAWLLYREAIGRRVWFAVLLLFSGGILLVLDQGRARSSQLIGLLAVIVATIAWALDNTLSRALAERDPGRVVMVKSVLGVLATTVIAFFVGERMPTIVVGAGLLMLGAIGYGLSLRFYLLAQRSFGAARTGSVFAFAPFIGALIAVALGDRSGSWMMFGGGVLMLAGVGLHLAEAHEHGHTHELLDHEHAHTHDDGHHDHRHEPMPDGSHSHRHIHAPTRHAHPHVPDAHHAHEHR